MIGWQQSNRAGQFLQYPFLRPLRSKKQESAAVFSSGILLIFDCGFPQQLNPYQAEDLDVLTWPPTV